MLNNNFKKDIIIKTREYFNKLTQDNNIICLHVRLTDNVDHSIMKKVNFDYYKKALSCFDKDIPVLIFSDDIESCMKQSLFFGSRFGTPKRGIYFMKLAKDVAEFRSKDGSKPSTTEIIIAAVIAILLLIVGISTETEALCGSVKNIIIITRI